MCWYSRGSNNAGMERSESITIEPYSGYLSQSYQSAMQTDKTYTRGYIYIEGDKPFMYFSSTYYSNQNVWEMSDNYSPSYMLYLYATYYDIQMYAYTPPIYEYYSYESIPPYYNYTPAIRYTKLQYMYNELD